MKNIIKFMAIGGLMLTTISTYAQDEEREKERRRRSHSTQQEFKFDLGLNNYMTNGEFPDQTGELYTVNPWKSWNIALGTVYKTQVAGPISLEWGGDVSWYNFNFEDASTLLVRNGAVAEFTTSADSEKTPEKSKLKVSYVNGSFVPMIKFGKSRKSIRAGVGVYGGYRLGSMTKFTYNRDGQTIKDKKSDNYYIENLRYGVRARIGFRDIDLYANYDLNNLFVASRGPELNVVSMGVSFLDFH